MSKYIHTYHLRRVSLNEFTCRRETRLRGWLGIFSHSTYLKLSVYGNPRFSIPHIFDDTQDWTFKASNIVEAQKMIRRAIVISAHDMLRDWRKAQFLRTSKEISIPPWVR